MRSLRALVAIWLASGLAAAACDDAGGGDADADGDVGTCDEVEDACETAGVVRCSVDATALEVCRLDGDCLSWAAIVDCTSASAHCREVAGEPRCVTECSDECEEVGATVCSRDVVLTCEDTGCLRWAEVENCAAAGQTCEVAAGEARCTCTDECDAAGATRCADAAEIVRVCTVGGDGCLAWTDGTDCALTGQACDDSVGEAVCSGECTGSCSTADESRCAGDVVEVCEALPAGCLGWVPGADCAALDPPLRCDESDGAASCRDPGDVGHGSCADPVVMAGDHFNLTGADFVADWADHVTLSSTGCTERVGSPDVVIAVSLTAGQTVRVSELGDLDVVLSLQTTCGGASDCVFSQDFLEISGHSYRAEVDGQVFAIVESWSPAPPAAAYDIRIDIMAAEVCDNTFDDDLDGAPDCEDADCFGVPPCTTELACTDDLDNDADSLLDCADPDCARVEACVPHQGVFELFEEGLPLDVDGSSLLFSPDGSDPNGYTWAVVPGLTELPYLAGSGVATTSLALGDDAFEAYDLTIMEGLSFYGERYTAVFVGSNGFVTLGSGSSSYAPSLDEFFAQPMVAGLFTDLNPSSGPAAVTVDEYADMVVVTYDGVMRYGTSDPNGFQIAITDDGSVELHFVALASPPAAQATMIGVGSGVGGEAYPAETDLVPRPK